MMMIMPVSTDNLDAMMALNEYCATHKIPTKTITIKSITGLSIGVIGKLVEAGYYIILKSVKANSLRIYELDAYYAKGTDKGGEVQGEIYTHENT